MNHIVIAVALMVGVAANGFADAPLPVATTVELKGDLAHGEELSGATLFGDFLIACPDEGADLNVLRRAGDGYALVRTVNLLGSDDEIDMEGLATDGKYVYVVGSHSSRRKQVDEDSNHRKNRKRLTKVKPHRESYNLFRISLDSEGRLVTNERVSLRDILEKDEVLQAFQDVPGKENGVDIEGIAAKEGKLWVGFRGPVLRGNFVPVLVFDFDTPDDYEMRFVRLGGRGVRDIVATETGLLILAGPIGDGDASYQLYHWNGEDCVPGEEPTERQLAMVGEIETAPGEKPEGLSLLSESPAAWRLLLVSDGSTKGKELVVSKGSAFSSLARQKSER